jgi:hypothetical protein
VAFVLLPPYNISVLILRLSDCDFSLCEDVCPFTIPPISSYAASRPFPAVRRCRGSWMESTDGSDCAHRPWAAGEWMAILACL